MMLLIGKILMDRIQKNLLKPGIKNQVNPSNPNNHGSDKESGRTAIFFLKKQEEGRKR
jgi:hypothetical protein